MTHIQMKSKRRAQENDVTKMMNNVFSGANAFGDASETLDGLMTSFSKHETAAVTSGASRSWAGAFGDERMAAPQMNHLIDMMTAKGKKRSAQEVVGQGSGGAQNIVFRLSWQCFGLEDSCMYIDGGRMRFWVSHELCMNNTLGSFLMPGLCL